MRHVEFEVQGTWDGGPLAIDEFARVEVRIDRTGGILALKVDATLYADPPPEDPPGSVDGLWDFEVVELFLLGDDERYLEIELGPHGHYLALSLAGQRQIVESGIPMEFTTERSGSRWSGEATLPLVWLPPNVHAANFYAIHGQGADRRYLASHRVPGSMPDFHRLEYFGATNLID